jgi:hypothetical protein
MAGILGRHIRSNVVGYIALFFALSLGTAWAATELAKNEVKSKHIGKGQVKKADLANNSVTSPKIADGSLLNQDFASGQLPTGPQGEPGPQGERGIQGEQGLRGEQGLQGDTGSPGLSNLEGVTAISPDDSSISRSVEVNCPAGKKAVGGGAGILGAISNVDLDSSRPKFNSGGSSGTDLVGWQAVATENSDGQAANWSLRVHAICANVSP